MANELVKQALRSIYDEEGTLTPESVVRRAEDPESPLHSYFTWDDSEAAEKWRQEEARALIRSFRVEIVTSERIFKIPLYIRDVGMEPEQGYKLVEDVSEKLLATKTVLRELEIALSHIERTVGLASVLGQEIVIRNLSSEVARIINSISLHQKAG